MMKLHPKFKVFYPDEEFLINGKLEGHYLYHFPHEDEAGAEWEVMNADAIKLSKGYFHIRHTEVAILKTKEYGDCLIVSIETGEELEKERPKIYELEEDFTARCHKDQSFHISFMDKEDEKDLKQATHIHIVDSDYYFPIEKFYFLENRKGPMDGKFIAVFKLGDGEEEPEGAEVING